MKARRSARRSESDSGRKATIYYDDYVTALAMAGEKKILYISLVINSGWLFGDQVVQVNNVTVNNSTLVARKP